MIHGYFFWIFTWAIERWWSAQGRSSLKRRDKESCMVTSVVWQATGILDIPV